MGGNGGREPSEEADVARSRLGRHAPNRLRSSVSERNDDSHDPERVATVADCAAAFADLIDSLRLKQVDVLGYQGGSLAAVELALSKPEQVRRVVLLGVPSSDAAYQVGERLPLVRQPLLVVRARDELWESTGRAESLLREARRVELQHPTGAVLDGDAEEVVRVTREFVDA